MKVDLAVGVILTADPVPEAAVMMIMPPLEGEMQTAEEALEVFLDLDRGVEHVATVGVGVEATLVV